MSTILKALHRLERERAPELDAPLREQVIAPEPAGSRGAPWLALCGGLLLGLALGASLLWLRPGTRAEAVASSQDAAETPADTAPAIPAPQPPVAPTASGGGLAYASEQEPLELEPPPETLDAPALDPEWESAAALEAEPEPEPPAEIRELPLEALQSPVEVVALRQPASERKRTLAPTVQHGNPEPPRPPRAPLPRVFVGKTLWHPSPERRVAWVEIGDEAAVELREGDVVGGLEVKRIDPSAVSFEHEGAELRRRVGLPAR